MFGAGAKRFEILGPVSAGAIVVAFCFLLLWHDPLLFWNDDYALSVLPVFADVARSARSPGCRGRGGERSAPWTVNPEIITAGNFCGRYHLSILSSPVAFLTPS